MAVITNKQKTFSCKSLIDEGTMVLCIGKSTAWESPYSETSPEPENSTISSIDDPIAYKVIQPIIPLNVNNSEIVAYAKLDNENGTIEYKNNFYSITDDFSVALSNDYTSVYIKVTLDGNEGGLLPTNVSFRSIGVFINTIGTFDDNGIALPASITDPGDLIIIDYRKPLYRDTDQAEVLELIIPF